MAIFDKFAPLKLRSNLVQKLGTDPFGVKFDRILHATRGTIGNREIVLAGTNNYLGLTFDPDCKDASIKAIEAHGTGTTGSRIANGSYFEHVELEQALAEHTGMESAIIFSTGFQTNLAAIATLAGPKDVIFIDADSHACIIDGCRLSAAPTIRFRHNSPEDLDKRLGRQGEIKDGIALVVIEGMYSMFGDKAPIRKFVEVCEKHGAYLFIDEAHSYGVFGPTGCGLAEEEGVLDRVDFISGTFSKSLASIGGFCLSRHKDFEITRKAMRAYMFTASPTPSNVASARAALEKIKTKPELRENLQARSQQLHAGLTDMGFELCAPPGPILAVRRPNEIVAAIEWNRLLENGVYVNLAVPPGTPQSSSLLRISLSAAHTKDDIEFILAALRDLKNNTGEIAGQAAEALASLS
ncbi:MAG TPA: aminotransferase class I/II-fold pyridoxal phosphate-dependent enzyme [Hellea balneolensis]|uniref:Aminotransferase class I/II-fold pyridoxal phosphate-dependent enzyme n=1 Tax=Hellea balneolensis TaxID=287478 RepID=A0A7C5R7P9_9PROT|nr:aminotransferase class I/II-fold pyridoxal phosphate-dependent enzyme [Hellea balneolensis]